MDNTTNINYFFYYLISVLFYYVLGILLNYTLGCVLCIQYKIHKCIIIVKIEFHLIIMLYFMSSTFKLLYAIGQFLLPLFLYIVSISRGEMKIIKFFFLYSLILWSIFKVRESWYVKFDLQYTKHRKYRISNIKTVKIHCPI